MLYQPTSRSDPWRRPAIKAIGLLRDLLDRYLVWERDHREMSRLLAFDDRTLADMGIERSTIAAAFRKHRRARRTGLDG